MKRPSFQFYPGDWMLNMKLRRCSHAARGAWIDTLCVLHDSDEYGVVRFPLAELATTAGAPLELLQELVTKGVLKGGDTGATPFQHRPRHAGKLGAPILLVDPMSGPVWFSSRLVVDEWRRGQQGSGTRFTPDNQPGRAPAAPPKDKPTRKPSRRVGEDSGGRPGDGASPSSSSSGTPKGSSSVAKATAARASGVSGAATPPPDDRAPRPRTSTRQPVPDPLPPVPLTVRAAQGIPDGLAPEERRKRYLWRVAKILIEELDGVPIKDSGTFLGLLHGKFPEAFLEAIELTSAEGKRPGGEYRAYLTATCQRLAGERASQHNKQATLEAGNDAAAAAFKQSLKTGGSNA